MMEFFKIFYFCLMCSIALFGIYNALTDDLPNPVKAVWVTACLIVIGAAIYVVIS